MLEKIAQSSLEYVVDKHANYVIQLAIQISPSNIVKSIMSNLCSKGLIASLCKQKHSSNVLEKVSCYNKI